MSWYWISTHCFVDSILSFFMLDLSHSGQIRLVGDALAAWRGRVEFLNSPSTREWGTVCTQNFHIHAARVVCRELGYHSSSAGMANFATIKCKTWFCVVYTFTPTKHLPIYILPMHHIVVKWLLSRFTWFDVTKNEKNFCYTLNQQVHNKQHILIGTMSA